ncbi:hypothetical protein JCM24511_07770 [Saitozyma sp. JCM 24511]|nr:hypothetical protein JCM24511_07770 [Saitozyma sp. JCM 24511]
MAALISVPAGRSVRRSQDSKWVDPLPEKGLIEMKLEDDLMHMWWKSRENGAVEDELIVFPGEATFSRVGQDPSGRTHILKFSSSDQKYFFWFQRASKEGDLRAAVDINELLQDPSYRPGTAALPEQPAESFPPTPGAPRLSHPEPAPAAAATSSTASTSTAPAAAPSQASTEDMARLLVEWAQSGGLASSQDEPAHLTDVLSPSNITALVTTHPGIISSIKPLVPSGLDLPENPSPQEIIPVLTAPQFTDAIASLDNALRSGGLPGGMMRELGLPESAGTGVKAFLDALKALKRPEAQGEDERMDED